MKTIGLFLGLMITCAIAVAEVMFSWSLAATLPERLLLCAITAPMALIGGVIISVGNEHIVHGRARGYFMLGFSVLLFFYCWNNFLGSLSMIDSGYAVNSDAQKMEELKMQIAQKKVDILAVGKFDVNKAAADLERMERAKVQCKLTWKEKVKDLNGTGCKSKALAGEDAIKMKMEAQKDYVKSLDEAKETITESTESGWMKTNPHFQQVARIIFGAKERAEDAQAWLRFIGSFIAMSISFLTGFFFADEYKTAIKRQLKAADAIAAQQGYSQPPRPAPITAQIKQAAANLDNRLNEIIAKGKDITMAKPSAEDYELDERFLDNRSEPRPQNTGMYKFVDTDSLPKVEPKRTPVEKKDIVSPSIGTSVRPQSGTSQIKSTVSKGRGKSAGLEFQVIEDAIISGDFFKFKDTVSIRNLVDYSKYISPNDSGIGKDTASVYCTMLKEKNRPLNKRQWKDLKGHH